MNMIVVNAVHQVQVNAPTDEDPTNVEFVRVLAPIAVNPNPIYIRRGSPDFEGQPIFHLQYDDDLVITVVDVSEFISKESSDTILSPDELDKLALEKLKNLLNN